MSGPRDLLVEPMCQDQMRSAHWKLIESPWIKGPDSKLGNLLSEFLVTIWHSDLADLAGTFDWHIY